MATLKDYLAYAKNNISPKLSEEASQTLISSYVGMHFVYLFLNTVSFFFLFQHVLSPSVFLILLINLVRRRWASIKPHFELAIITHALGLLHQRHSSARSTVHSVVYF